MPAMEQWPPGASGGRAVDEGRKWFADFKIGLVVFGVLLIVASLAAVGVRLLGF
jgi:hypothetical protein